MSQFLKRIFTLYLISASHYNGVVTEFDKKLKKNLLLQSDHNKKNKSV